MALLTRKKLQFNQDFPTEIKSMIFKEHYFQSREFTTPSKLRLVCRLWRDIVDNTPEVWCTVIIYFYRIVSYESMKQYLTMCLDRSKNFPLTIILDEMYSGKKITINEIISVFDDIMRVSTRVAHLDIDATSSKGDKLEISKKFRQLTLADFPILKTVAISSFDELYPDDNECHELFKNSPVLQILSLSETVYNPLVFKCFTQITDLRLCSASVIRCVSSLMFIPQLEYLTLRDVVWDDRSRRITTELIFADKSTSFVHSSLISLKINQDGEKVLALLFNSIVCPALQHLDISRECEERRLMGSIAVFLERSKCSLRSLRIRAVIISNPLWPILDKVYNTLEKLVLEEYVSPGPRSAILPSLFKKLHSTTYLTRLQQLRLWQCNSEDYDYNLILQALTARHNISSVFVLFMAVIEYVERSTPIPEAAVVEGFKQLIGDGMSISFILDDEDSSRANVKFEEEFINKLLLAQHYPYSIGIW